MDNRAAVVVQPPVPPDASIIWLHGLGADGHDFEPLVPTLGFAPSAAVRFVFPHTPRRAVTIHNGMVMRAWYDIASPDFTRREDADGIRASANALESLIQHELELGIPGHRIILAGFSQGGAVALHTGLRYGGKLGGILALSAYLPLQDSCAAAGTAKRNLPILMCHGTEDNVVPLQLAAAGRDHLRSLGYSVKWREYPMAHNLCDAEITAISAWLHSVLETG